MMPGGKASRAKGLLGEREVAAIWAAAGHAVRNLEATGDHLIVGQGWTIHSEAKRHETLRLPLWLRQAAAEAPAGAVPVVAFRRSRAAWFACLPRDSLQRMLGVSRPGLVTFHMWFDRPGPWQLDRWLLQTAADAPAGAVPILELTAAGGAGVYSCLRLDLLAAILAPAGAAA